MPPRPSRLRAWLELFRVPNLLTVPGDPIAGAMLGGATAWESTEMALCAGGVVLVYAAGLALNDVADFAEDLRERPARPLPSGHISRAAAAVAGALLLLAGVGLLFAAGPRPGGAGMALAFSVVAYNFYLKHTAFGPLTMGFCRGWSLVAGAFAIDRLPPPGAWLAAAALIAYTATLTTFARRETDARSRVTPKLIGRLIGGFLVLQAAFVLASGFAPLSGALALALLALWPLNALLRRRFHAS